jgi:hypothetical protein
MDKYWKAAVVIAGMVSILIVLYWTRFQAVPVNYAYSPAFYKINRLTGETTLTVGKEFVIVKELNERSSQSDTLPKSSPEQDHAPEPNN